jgi:O-antigen/teichoic acid export membrane protein
LIYNNVIIALFVITANALVAWRLFPAFRINPVRYWNNEVLCQILNFSWKIQLTNITQLLIFQLDRVLLSHFVGLSAVSYYEVANRIASHAKGVISSIFSPMVPAASTLHAVENREKIAGLYRRSFKYMALISIPCSLLIIALAHPFFHTWMGPGYGVSAYSLQLLMASYVLNLLTGPGGFILNGINKPEIGMMSSVVAGITNFVLCIILVQVIGYYGVIIGIFASIITSGVFFIWMVHRNIDGLSWQLYPQVFSRPLMLSLPLAVMLFFIDSVLPLVGYPVLLMSGIFYMLLVLFGLSYGDYLDSFDREMFRRCLPFARKG